MFVAVLFLSLIACGLASPLGVNPGPSLADDVITPLADDSATWKSWFGPKPEELPSKDWTLVSYADGSPIPGLAEYRAKHNQALIVNGTNAKPGEQKYMVSFQLEYQGKMYHLCGGSLLSANKVLSAQHCLTYFDEFPNNHKVGLGYYQLSLGLNNEGSQLIPVASVAKKPNYSEGNGFPNDVMVLTLEYDAILSSTVQTTYVAYNSPESLAGFPVSLTGWGMMGGSLPSADILQYAEFTVISKAECQQYWGSSILDEHVCVMGKMNGNVVMGGCMGDSGGPLVYSAGSNKYQVGIVSWGHAECDVQYPSVYSSPFVSWNFIFTS